MRILDKIYLLSIICCYTFLQSCNNQENRVSYKNSYEKTDLYSDSISKVKIDNISLSTINILNNWIEYQELKEVINSLENNEFSFFKDNKEYIII